MDNNLFKVRKIVSFEDCLKYVHFLGAIKKSKDKELYYQNLCTLCDTLNDAAGGIPWNFAIFKPFYVRYSRVQRIFIVVKEEHVKFVSEFQ